MLNRRINASRSAARFAMTFAALVFLLAPSPGQDAPKPPVISPLARLMAARSIFIEHAGGRLPNDVIGDAFQGWGHYTVVADPGQADLIASINAPVSDSGVSMGSTAGGRRPGGSSSASRSLSSSNVTQIRLLVLDARDRAVLWSGTEQPKYARKEREREDHLVEASLRLFRRFRDTIEPEPAP